MYVRIRYAAIAICLTYTLTATHAAQAQFSRFLERAKEIADSVGDKVVEEVDRFEDSVLRTGDQEAAETSAEPQDASVGAAAAPDPIAGGVLDYNALLKLYMAAHHDLIDTAGFALHHYLLFEAPGRGPECQQLWNDSRNSILFEELVQRQRGPFRDALDRYRSETLPGIYTMEANLILNRYDTARNVFPVVSVHINNPGFDPEYRCTLPAAPGGVSYVPRTFQLERFSMDLAMEIPMNRDRAVAFIDNNPQTFNMGSNTTDYYLRVPAKVRVNPLPVVNSSGHVTFSVEMLEVEMIDPSNAEHIHTIAFDDSAADETANQDSASASADSSSLLPMDRTALLLYMVRDKPEVLSETVLRELTRAQIAEEQRYWNTIDQNVGSSMNSSFSSNLNRRTPLLAYEWQRLRNSDRGLATEVFDAFLRPDSSWAFHQRDPRYDARLDHYVGVSVFDREAIGFGPAEKAHETVFDTSVDRGMSKYPTPDHLVPELAPVMQDFLQSMAAQLPSRLRLDFELQASYDPASGRLQLSNMYSYGNGEPVSPLSLHQRTRFADEGEALESAISRPLPRSAEGRVIYQLPNFTQVDENRPGLHQSITATRRLREALYSQSGGGVNMGTVEALALDRELAFPAVAVSLETVQRAQGERYRRSATFPVIARAVLDVERMATVGLEYPGNPGSPFQQTWQSAALLANIAGLELLDQDGRLIAEVGL